MTLANFYSSNTTAGPIAAAMELVCPVNSLSTLRAAVDHGADWIRLDHRAHNQTEEMRDLNPDYAVLIRRGIRYAHDRRSRVLFAIETDEQASSWSSLRDMIDLVAQCGVDAVALSDPSLLLYAAAQHPQLSLHYETHEDCIDHDTINFFHRRFGVARALLPRVLTLAQVAHLATNTQVELQVTGFGRQCSLITPSSGPSLDGLRLRAHDARSIGNTPGPHLCGATERAANDNCFTLDKPSDTSVLTLLPQLTSLGVRAIQAEALEHGPVHLAQVMQVWREAVDECLENLDHYAVKPSWIAELRRASPHR